MQLLEDLGSPGELLEAKPQAAQLQLGLEPQSLVLSTRKRLQRAAVEALQVEGLAMFGFDCLMPGSKCTDSMLYDVVSGFYLDILHPKVMYKALLQNTCLQQLTSGHSLRLRNV